VVFREGDDSDHLYIVRTGLARALREHSDGRSITLSNFVPGDIFGELAMFDSERRSATVDTLESTEVVAILGGGHAAIDGRTSGDRVNHRRAGTATAGHERAARPAVIPNGAEQGGGVLGQLVQAARVDAEGDGDVMITSTRRPRPAAGSSRESPAAFWRCSNALGSSPRPGQVDRARTRTRLERYVY